MAGENKSKEVGRSEHRGNTVDYIYDKCATCGKLFDEQNTKITQLKDAQGENEKLKNAYNGLEFIMDAKISQLEQRLAECEAVVKFYGDEKTYLPFDQGHKHNGGNKARQYLTKWGVK